MHTESLDQWTHDHEFLGRNHGRNERRTWLVVGLTAIMMVAEIAGGVLFGSMALLADGWHMSTHAAALGISALAYLYARRHRGNPRFAFGTGKLGDLAAFASAVVLGMVALLIGYESILRLARPVPIAHGEAIAVAFVGLAVNVVCAWLLRDDHQEGHRHGHHHGPEHHDGDGEATNDRQVRHDHDHRDHNLRAAYLHVLADAATSILAIAGLFIAMQLGFAWIDPAVGMVGALVIAYWSFGLIRDSGRVLLDIVPDRAVAGAIRSRLETGGDRIADLHIWQVGPGHRAVVVSIVSDHPMPPASYKKRLAGVPGLSHLTVEVEARDKAAATTRRCSPLAPG